ncbi:transposase [Rhodococcus sp. USK10]|uniref:transposase n=1 Tax=Rhodococcus sp. USK10 TaxID=2789739 RepID=UPI0035B51B89
MAPRQQGRPDQSDRGDALAVRRAAHPPGEPRHSPRRRRHPARLWLLAEWPAGADEPTDYWLSTLPAETPLKELVRLAKLRWRVEHDYRELKTGLGLDHFEGRSWLGWHHHATLVTAAHLFLTTLRLTDPKAAGQD